MNDPLKPKANGHKDKVTIKKISIQYVRGIKELTCNFDLKPNIPHIFVAPNGKGKTSFATAFSWLKKEGLKMNVKDAYKNKPENEPKLTITYEENGEEDTLTADKDNNEIQNKFKVLVINSELKASTKKRPIKVKVNEIEIEKEIEEPNIEGPKIVFLPKIPKDVEIDDHIFKRFHFQNRMSEIFPSINDFFNDHKAMAMLNLRKLRMIEPYRKEFLDSLKGMRTLQGTKKEILSIIKAKMRSQALWKKPLDYAKSLFNEKDSNTRLLKAIRLLALANTHTYAVKLKRKKEYCRFILHKEHTENLFKPFATWLTVEPTCDEEKGFYLQIKDAQRISNGERDLINILAYMEKAKYSMEDKHFILIIDEVFDYLDDANLLVAQSYILRFIKHFELHSQYSIFPILLTHIHPSYFRTYCFSDMKVDYLFQTPNYNKCENIASLIKLRNEKGKDEGQKDIANQISKYMFHFHSDYPKDLNLKLKANEWNDVNVFKRYCMKHLDYYLGIKAETDKKENVKPYDSLAVCIALREIIEKYCYTMLGKKYQDEFLDTHETLPKIEFAKKHGVEVPETFILLSNVYNEHLHVRGNHIELDLLLSRLGNEGIKHMIQEVKQAAMCLYLKEHCSEELLACVLTPGVIKSIEGICMDLGHDFTFKKDPMGYAARVIYVWMQGGGFIRCEGTDVTLDGFSTFFPDARDQQIIEQWEQSVAQGRIPFYG
jgi:hypothetical protein